VPRRRRRKEKEKEKEKVQEKEKEKEKDQRAETGAWIAHLLFIGFRTIVYGRQA